MIDLWKTKDIQHALAMLIHMEGEGVTSLPAVKDRLQGAIEERLLAVRKENIRYSRQGAPIKKALARIRCGKCGHPAKLEPVNVSKCTRVGGGYNASIACTNTLCRHVEFTRATVEELLAAVGFKVDKKVKRGGCNGRR